MAPAKPLGTPEEVASYLRKHVRTLANWRCQGAGPNYIKTEGGVLYRWSDVEAWLKANTIQPGKAA